jgi:hypothetical protein
MEIPGRAAPMKTRDFLLLLVALLLVAYGVGNLFFDQMGDGGEVPTRHEFIDRHVIYGGQYFSAELLTAELEDYARPAR